MHLVQGLVELSVESLSDCFVLAAVLFALPSELLCLKLLLLAVVDKKLEGHSSALIRGDSVLRVQYLELHLLLDGHVECRVVPHSGLPRYLLLHNLERFVGKLLADSEIGRV